MKRILEWLEVIIMAGGLIYFIWFSLKVLSRLETTIHLLNG